MSDRGSGSLHSTPRVLATIQAAARSLFVSPVLAAPTLAVAFPQHSDEHRPERPVLLATRRHLGTVARALRPTRRSAYGRSHSPGHAQVGPGLNERASARASSASPRSLSASAICRASAATSSNPASDSPDARASNLSTDSSRVSIVLASRLRVWRIVHCPPEREHGVAPLAVEVFERGGWLGDAVPPMRPGGLPDSPHAARDAIARRATAVLIRTARLASPRLAALPACR
jgi:hypothetical protein